jgi:N-acyl-D-amino-acid deacylase
MTILIKNVQLIDGTGRTPAKADVLVKNDKISAVGIFPNYRADETIDGMGAYLAPGFIDINTDSDHYLTLFDNPGQESFLLQGVTTIIGGHCGSSLAPIMYGSLEILREWADINKTNVNWRTLKELFQTLEKKKIGVNFGTLVGHATIRDSIAKTARTGGSKKELSKNEMKVFISILDRAMKEGALGISFGPGHFGEKEIPYGELKALSSFAAEKGGISAIHLRDEKEGAEDSMKEILKMAKDSKAEILISHLRPVIGHEESCANAVALAEKSPFKKKIHFDACPFAESVALLESFLPDWARKEGKESALENIKFPAIRKKIIRDFPPLSGKNITIISAPGNEYLVGKSLKRFSKNSNATLAMGMTKLMELTKFRAAASYENANAEKSVELLKKDMAVLGSNSASFRERNEFLKKSINPEKSSRTFLKFLELSEKENIMPIEKAVYKMTGLPAQIMKIRGRGIISDGYFADLVLFKDAKIKEVIINGKRAVKDGEISNSSSGKTLKRSGA